jgi:hypothetical protein
MICEACKEEFIHSDEEEDLCPDCIAAMEEGTIKILLGKKDIAWVLREDGSREQYTGEDYEAGE